MGAGVKWESVSPRVSDLGLAALHGSTPDVSIAGYGLGGGVGWYGRKHGLFTNSITAIELVTADGRLRRVDHDHEPELFWALRGGGGNFGVVTALEFRLFPISEVYAGALFFPWERSAEVLQAWLEWTQTVPDEVTSVGRILQFPPLEMVPRALRGKSFAVVHAYVLGSEAEGERLLAPLRALGPEIDTVAMVPPVALSEMHMDPPDPVPYSGEHLVLDRLPRARSTRSSRPPGRARARRSSRSRSATRAGRSRRGAATTEPSTSSPASTCTSASAWCSTRASAPPRVRSTADSGSRRRTGRAAT